MHGMVMLEIVVVFAIIGILIRMSTISYQHQHHTMHQLEHVVQSLTDNNDTYTETELPFAHSDTC